MKELTPLYLKRVTLVSKFNVFYVKGLTFYLKFKRTLAAHIIRL